MKTLGLLGGMSWESTADYYTLINEGVKENLGGLHSAKILMYSVDFAELADCLANDDWNKIANILVKSAKNIEQAGADCIMICTNTMHNVADAIKAEINMPLIHIAEVTADALKKAGISKAALLGTKMTMELPFYKEKLNAQGIEAVMPNKEDRALLNAIIFDELCLGIKEDTSKEHMLRMIAELKTQGAQAVILGCTELGGVIKQTDTDMQLFDTTVIHVKSAVNFALEKI